jgi:hypothetical protein
MNIGVILFLIVINILIFIRFKQNFFIENFISNEDVQNYFNDNLHKDYPKYNTKLDKIFVSLASYRDDECSDTIRSIYDNADKPENIYIGICSQNHPDEVKEECVPSARMDGFRTLLGWNVPRYYKYKNNIRVNRLKHTDALGPNYARYLCSHLWKGEQYYMQIDSHLNFFKGWDTTIKNMYNQLPHTKCILTHYPPTSGSTNESNPSFTCSAHYEDNFHIISESQLIDKLDKPIRTPYFSAGLFFADASFLHDVPYDPYLPYLFQGEEILMAARLYTNGWDMYNLGQSIATHNYARDDKPHFWNDNSHKNWKEIQKESNKRYYKLIGQDTEDIHPDFLHRIKEYGMGSVRSLSDYFKFAGIDTKNKKVISRCKSRFDNDKNEWIEQK